MWKRKQKSFLVPKHYIGTVRFLSGEKQTGPSIFGESKSLGDDNIGEVCGFKTAVAALSWGRWFLTPYVFVFSMTDRIVAIRFPSWLS